MRKGNTCPRGTVRTFDDLMNRVIPEPNSGCFLWLGGTNEHGYGILTVDRVNVKAHRLSWALWTGTTITPSQKVLHRCDTPACVNPEHLFLGTILDNVRDMHSKGRARKATGDASGLRRHPELVRRGERSPRATIDDATVREIRRSAESGRVCAARLGIGAGAVFAVRAGKTWRHVSG